MLFRERFVTFNSSFANSLPHHFNQRNYLPQPSQSVQASAHNSRCELDHALLGANHRHHPICVKRLFDVFLFPALFRHVRQTEVNSLSFFRHNCKYFRFLYLISLGEFKNIFFHGKSSRYSIPISAFQFSQLMLWPIACTIPHCNK